jgi:tetratricopeptide (TPR) repeat protein
VKGQDAFQAYWASRALDDLEKARELFTEAERSDPNFALASFYTAVAENELRQHDSAIARLSALAGRGVDFLPETYLHLAYAYTKKYTDEDYTLAEGALEKSEREARTRDRSSFLPVVQGYRVFLYSLIGGRSKRPNRASISRTQSLKESGCLLIQRLPSLTAETPFSWKCTTP